MARLPSQRFVRLGADVAPGFDLIISGRDASASTQLFNAIRPLIASITYEEDEQLASKLEIAVINQPEALLGSSVNWDAVIDSKAFAEGNFIDLYLGYGNTTDFVGRTEITEWLPVFPEEGPGQFQIVALDARHKMMEGNQFKLKDAAKDRKRKTSYSNMADEQIVKKIAEKYSMSVDVDSTESKKHTKVSRTAAGTTTKRSVFPTRIHQSGVTDWQFLLRLAEINRFDLWVDYNPISKKWVLNFKKRLDAGQADFQFNYNGKDGSLISAEPAFVMTGQTTDVEVLTFDRRNRKLERSVITEATAAENVNFRTATPGNFQAKKTITKGARVRFSAFGQVIEAFTDRPFRSRTEAETFVKNWLKERERDFLVLRGATVGVETLHPRQIHEFVGMGTRLDGFYRLTQTRQILVPNSLYKTELMGNKVLSQEIARRKATTKVQTKATPQES
jgi:phage protein D